MRFRVLVLFFLLLIRNGHAQRSDSVLIGSDTDLGGIGWLDQFTFIHFPPQNKVDQWVKKIEMFGKYDSLQMVKLVEELASIQTKESFALLYLLCCQPMMIKHLTAYNSFASAVQTLNGFRALNTYYLNDEVPGNLNRIDFANTVILKCRMKARMTCYYRKL